MSAESVFPVEINQWRCPACGMNLTGKSYNLDDGRSKCSKTWHLRAPVCQKYIRADAAEAKSG